MKITALLFILSTISIVVFASNAKPFDQEIGLVNCTNVLKHLSNINLMPKAESFYNIPMNKTYVGDITKLKSINGGQEINVICDENNIFTGLVLKIENNTDNYERYYNILKQKYKMIDIKNNIQSPGVLFTQGNSRIILDIDQNDYTILTISYVSKKLSKAIAIQSKMYRGSF